MSENSRQVGGEHYRSRIQHWDFVVAHGLNYFEAVATKYLTRDRRKNGVEDLEKAGHFIDKLIELLEGGSRLPRLECNPDVSVEDYIIANNLNYLQANIIELIVVSGKGAYSHATVDILKMARCQLNLYIRVYLRAEDGDEEAMRFLGMESRKNLAWLDDIVAPFLSQAKATLASTI